MWRSKICIVKAFKSEDWSNNCVIVGFLLWTQADRSKTPENFVLSPYYAVIIDEIIKKSIDSSSNSSKLRTTCYEVLRIVLGAGPTDCYAILESSVGRLVELLNAVNEFSYLDLLVLQKQDAFL